jgi:hypothetical protein
MPNVYVEARPKGRPNDGPIEDYVVEDRANHVLPLQGPKRGHCLGPQGRPQAFRRPGPEPQQGKTGHGRSA